MADSEDRKPRRRERFHGRIDRDGLCEWPGCEEAGEFRAPREATSSKPHTLPQDRWRWFCLEHVREFNEGYRFKGIPDWNEPKNGWERQTSEFARNAYADVFADELGMMRGRYGADAFPAGARPGSRVRLSPEDMTALQAFDLSETASWEDVRSRYKELVRRYHPDMNGGDRSHEGELQAVIDAYTQLRRSAAFSD